MDHGAIVADHAIIKDWCIVTASAMVTSHQIHEPESLIVGIPAKSIRKITEKNRELIEFSTDLYSNLAS
jgi:carbonic anhydrase/acetyltransferase-like protein (isoleucine patch superfamily)